MASYRVVRYARVAFEQIVEADGHDAAADKACNTPDDWIIVADDQYDMEVDEVSS